jgi:hypothetical protein
MLIHLLQWYPGNLTESVLIDRVFTQEQESGLSPGGSCAHRLGQFLRTLAVVASASRSPPHASDRFSRSSLASSWLNHKLNASDRAR